MSSSEIKNCSGLDYLNTIQHNSISLVLTDPPYIISRDSGMNKHYNKVAENKSNGVEYVKTEKEWEEYKTKKNIIDDKQGKQRDNYMKYGTILGKKYCKKTDFGSWDSEFTIQMLDDFIGEFYKKLKTGGTLILFFDLWKITTLKEIMEKHKFKQIRFLEWIKTNPIPINSKINYLTNCREIAILGVKGGKPTFNSQYDNAIYQFPMAAGKHRFHPTQKSLPLFEELIRKHSNEGDIVLDTFLGGGTTAIACKNTNRIYKCCEISQDYYAKVMEIMEMD